jgi:hypothetical protein
VAAKKDQKASSDWGIHAKDEGTLNDWGEETPDFAHQADPCVRIDNPFNLMPILYAN